MKVNKSDHPFPIFFPLITTTSGQFADHNHNKLAAINFSPAKFTTTTTAAVSVWVCFGTQQQPWKGKNQQKRKMNFNFSFSVYYLLR